MPVDRTIAEDLAVTLANLYRGAHTRLATDLSRRLSSGLDTPTWAADKLAGLANLRAWTERLIARLDGDMTRQVEQLIALAYTRGGKAGQEELARLAQAAPGDLAATRAALPGNEALQRMAWSLVTGLRGTHTQILRWSMDSYRAVVATAGVPDVLLGTSTRRRAAQVAWEKLLSQGITGFRDRSGRNWELASYTEMATRSVTAQAAVEGHLDRLTSAGIDLVIVSNAPQECVRCRPWEGKILTSTGPGGRQNLEVEHATQDGKKVKVQVAGSVDEAIAAGLMHPNCRHSLSAYLAGVTKPPQQTADPQGDVDRQRLRAMERTLRQWKLREQAAIDPAAKAQAAAKVREWQAAIRAHCASTTAKRQPAREQIGVAR